VVGEGDGRRELTQIRASRSEPRTHVVVTVKKPVAKPVVKPPVKPVAPKPAPKPSSPKSWNALWAPYPAWVRDFAYCVARHESWDAGLWRAEYRGPLPSTASGFAQWTNPTWRGHTARAGVGQQYSRAMHAPPAVQVQVFAHHMTSYRDRAYAARPWNGTNCGYGT
jgi:hypothetical protein